MKILSFILSIYIFALNIASCEDYSAFHDEVKTEISQTADNDHQHQGSDLCSPFCNCQCCHINTMQFKIINIKFNIAFYSTQDFFYLNGSEKDFVTSILQPPKG